MSAAPGTFTRCAKPAVNPAGDPFTFRRRLDPPRDTGCNQPKQSSLSPAERRGCAWSAGRRWPLNVTCGESGCRVCRVAGAPDRDIWARRAVRALVACPGGLAAGGPDYVWRASRARHASPARTPGPAPRSPGRWPTETRAERRISHTGTIPPVTTRDRYKPSPGRTFASSRGSRPPEAGGVARLWQGESPGLSVSRTTGAWRWWRWQ